MVLRGVEAEKISTGDVIVFFSKREDPIIHRVVEKGEKGGKIYFHTKGDNNEGSIRSTALDETNVSEDVVIGKAVLRVPLLGYVKIWAVDLLKMLESFEQRLKCGLFLTLLPAYLRAEQLAIEVKKTQEIAYRDALTDTLNRRAYNEFGNLLVHDCLTQNIPLSIIVFDVDNFKKFNTQHGHLGGDYALKELSKLVQSQLRGSDSLFRYDRAEYSEKNRPEQLFRLGGDEFVILLFGATASQSIIAANRIYNVIESSTFNYKGQSFNISIKAGIATLREDGDTLQQLYQKGDERAKIAEERGKAQFYHPLLDNE